jgi:hypothetical protein
MQNILLLSLRRQNHPNPVKALCLTNHPYFLKTGASSLNLLLGFTAKQSFDKTK